MVKITFAIMALVAAPLTVSAQESPAATPAPALLEQPAAQPQPPSPEAEPQQRGGQSGLFDRAPSFQAPAQQKLTAQQAQQAAREQQMARERARQQLRLFESMLQNAVNQGGMGFLKQIQQVLPAQDLLLSGSPQVSGVRLDGYGVVYHVFVPVIRQPIAMMLDALRRDPALLQAMLEAQRRQQQQQSTRPMPAGDTPREPVAPPAAPLLDRELMSDPDAVYTREVQGALIEAMLEYSSTLGIGADEYLTVAARDNGALADPLVLSNRYSTLVFSIRGRDLEAYRQGKITKAEAFKTVTIREQ